MHLLKKTLLLILAFSFYTCSENSTDLSENENNDFEEKIFEGDVTLRNQTEVDEFSAENYTKINGSFRIWDDPNDDDDINDLSGLSSLSVISDDFSLGGFNELETLKGLENISYYNLIAISTTESLITTSHLSANIESSSIEVAQISINSNLKLQDLNGLHIIKGIAISSNNLIGYGISVSYNDSLQNLEGLDNISGHVGESLQIIGNQNLATANALNQITGLTTKQYSSNTGLTIKDNPNLQTIDFTSLLTIPHSFTDSNHNYPNSITVINNPKLNEITFPNLEGVGTGIIIKENKQIDVIDIPKMTSNLFAPTVPGQFSSRINVSNNDELLFVDLGKLNEIGNLNFFRNQSLETFNLSNLTYAGTFRMLENFALNDISSLSSLNDVGGYNGSSSNFEFEIGNASLPLKDYCALTPVISKVIADNPSWGTSKYIYVDHATQTYIRYSDIASGNCVVK